MAFKKLVEDRIREIQDEGEYYQNPPFEYPFATFSVRAGVDLRYKLDLLTWYMGFGNRNGLICSILEQAVQDAEEVFTSNGMALGDSSTPPKLLSEAIEEGLAAIREGRTPWVPDGRTVDEFERRLEQAA